MYDDMKVDEAEEGIDGYGLGSTTPRSNGGYDAAHDAFASHGGSTWRCDYRTFEKSASNSLVFPSGKNTMTFVLPFGSKLS